MNLFSLKNYKKIIELGKKNKYEFITFDKIDTIQDDPNCNYCLLRHDVDADVVAAYKLSLIENELNTQSTYFFMLSSPVYNLFSRFNRKYVFEIIKNGHEIGLHFDVYQCDIKNLENSIQKEKNILENMFDVRISTVSFHQPSNDIINKQIALKGLKNTYNRKDMKNFQYISDSNMVWRDKTPIEIFENTLYTKVQFLFHPMWWVYADGELSTEDVWNNTIFSNLNSCQEQLHNFERAFGRKRIFEIKDEGNEI